MRSATWDVVAWNDAAAATLTDYTTLSPQRRNILRLIFVDPHVRGVQANWERVARFAVGAFRADVARGGATQAVQAFVDEMRAASAEFDALWRDHDVRSHEEGTKEIHHPAVGRIALEYSAFAVSGRPDQTLVIFTPETAADRALVRSLVAARASAGRADARRMMVRVSSDECAVTPYRRSPHRAPSPRSAPSHSALIPSRIFNFHLA